MTKSFRNEYKKRLKSDFSISNGNVIVTKTAKRDWTCDVLVMYGKKDGTDANVTVRHAVALRGLNLLTINSITTLMRMKVNAKNVSEASTIVIGDVTMAAHTTCILN